MTKRIFRSTVAVAAAVLAASLVIIMGCLYSYFATVQENQLRDELELAAAAVETQGSDYLESLDTSRIRLTWIAQDGKVLFDNQAGAASMENHAGREEFREAALAGVGESTRYSDTLLQKTIYYARRLDDGTVLRVSVSRMTLGSLTISMLSPILLVAAVALVLSAALAKRVSRRIVDPLNHLDLENPLENDTYDELSPLLLRINQQHRLIDAQMQQLRQRQEEFTQITGSMKEGLVLLNAKDMVVSINRAAMDAFGADESCVEKSFLTLERSHEVSTALREAKQKGHGETHITRGGREYQLDLSRIESDGEVAGTAVLVFDITEQADAERSRREFTANVSHELKTPLQSIMGSAELIEKGLVKPEDMQLFTGRIRTEASRLVALIDDIIRLSQLDEGAELPCEEVELLELAKDTAHSLEQAAAERWVQIKAAGESVKILAPRRLVGEIVYNLADNAVKYNRPGGSVDVEVREEDGSALIRVQDTGIGIPEEHQSRVFERFYRVDKSHSRSSGGTGLGLSIVKHAVARLGGSIKLTSYPGEGTAVEVRLPKAK